MSSDIGNALSSAFGIDDATKNALGGFMGDPTPGAAPPSSSAAGVAQANAPQSAGLFDAIANFFSINTGLRLVVVILGVGLVLIAIMELVKNNPQVQQVVATTAKVAAVAA